MDIDRLATASAERRHGLITHHQFLELGATQKMIENRAATGRFPRVHRDVYRVAGSVNTFHQKVLAACLSAGEAGVASHRAAGYLWHLEGVEPTVEITIPETQKAVLRGVVLHRAVKPTPFRHLIDGVPVTPLPRTFIDLAAVLGRKELERALDEACAQRLIVPGYLKRHLDKLGRRGRKGAGVLNEILEERGDGPFVHHGFERRLARVLDRGGVPRPTVQYEVRIPNGVTKYIDFAYPEEMVAIEADSFRWHSTKHAWARDRATRVELAALGWRVLPITWHDMVTRPMWVVEQVQLALTSVEVRKLIAK